MKIFINIKYIIKRLYESVYIDLCLVRMCEEHLLENSLIPE